jgi:hypothetical protein
MEIVTIVIAIGLPSAMIGFCFRRIEKKLDKKQSEQEEREECRQELNLLVVKGVTASMALGEASALALKNGVTNGKTTSALNYSKTVKNEIKDFLFKQGIKESI